MNRNLNIEAEGSELILRNESGDHVIIPKKDRAKIKAMIDRGNHFAVDSYVDTLPIDSSYAVDGTLVPRDTLSTPSSSIYTGEPFKEATGVSKLTDDAVIKLAESTIITSEYTPSPVQVNEARRDNTYTTIDSKNIEKDLNTLSEDDVNELKYRDNYIKSGGAKEIERDSESDDIQTLSDSNVKEIQSMLVSEGFLKTDNINVDKKNKEEVKALQRQLVNEGFNLGKFGPNKDGVDGLYGKLTTKAAIDYVKSKEVDGIAGVKTKKAYSEYLESKLKPTLVKRTIIFSAVFSR